MTSPALLLPLLRSTCASGRYAPLWMASVFFTVVLVGLVDRRPQWLLLSAVLFAGFDAVRWMLLTGNIAVLELLFGATAVAALSQRRHWLFSLGLGAATFLKIMPGAFSVLPLIDGDRRRGVIAAAGVLLSFAGLHALFFLTMPDLFARYWEQILGGFGGFVGAEVIYGGPAHPSILSLLSDASATLTGRSWPALPLYAVIAAAIIADLFYLTWTSRHPQLLALWGLGLLAAMPRLKPYAFGLGLIPLYLGAKSQARWRQMLLVVVGCLLPVVASTLSAEAGSARILGYGQLFGLVGAYLIVRISTTRLVTAS